MIRRGIWRFSRKASLDQGGRANLHLQAVRQKPIAHAGIDGVSDEAARRAGCILQPRVDPCIARLGEKGCLVSNTEIKPVIRARLDPPARSVNIRCRQRAMDAGVTKVAAPRAEEPLELLVAPIARIAGIARVGSRLANQSNERSRSKAEAADRSRV